MDRRKFLQIAGASAAGAAGVVVFGLPTESTSDAAHADATEKLRSNSSVQTMASFRQGNHRVEIVKMGDTEMMRLDGRELPHHVFTKINSGYASHLVPFQDFSNAKDLAKRLVDGNGTLFIL